MDHLVNSFLKGNTGDFKSAQALESLGSSSEKLREIVRDLETRIFYLEDELQTLKAQKSPKQQALPNWMLQMDFAESLLYDFTGNSTTIHTKVVDLAKFLKPGSFLWKIPDFKSKFQEKSEVISPQFYTGPFGYKMQIELDSNGYASGTNTHLSISYRLVSGEFDDLLEWPFSGNVAFTLIDQKATGNEFSARNVQVNVTSQDCSASIFKKPLKNYKNAGGCGEPNFVSHRLLFNGDYIKNDAVYVLITINV